MGTSLTIGQAAKETGLTPKAIRLYERRGLIRTLERSSAGYRLYGADDIETMGFIRRARSLGLPLDDIKGILSIQKLGAPPCDSVRNMITERINDIDDTISRLTALKTALITTRDVDSAENGQSACPIVDAAHHCAEEATAVRGQTFSGQR